MTFSILACLCVLGGGGRVRMGGCQWFSIWVYLWLFHAAWMLRGRQTQVCREHRQVQHTLSLHQHSPMLSSLAVGNQLLRLFDLLISLAKKHGVSALKQTSVKLQYIYIYTYEQLHIVNESSATKDHQSTFTNIHLNSVFTLPPGNQTLRAGKSPNWMEVSSLENRLSLWSIFHCQPCLMTPEGKLRGLNYGASPFVMGKRSITLKNQHDQTSPKYISPTFTWKHMEHHPF